jgi:hypothetical protein
MKLYQEVLLFIDKAWLSLSWWVLRHILNVLMDVELAWKQGDIILNICT